MTTKRSTVETIRRLSCWDVEDCDLRRVFFDFLENGGPWLRVGDGGPLMDNYLIAQGLALGDLVLIYKWGPHV